MQFLTTEKGWHTIIQKKTPQTMSRIFSDHRKGILKNFHLVNHFVFSDKSLQFPK